MEAVKLLVTGAANGIGEAFVNLAIHKLDQAEYRNADDINVIYTIDKIYKSRGDYHNQGIGTNVIVKPYYSETGVDNINRLPKIPGITHLFNNAGIQEGTNEEILKTNLLGTINCTEFYALNNTSIKAVLNQASVSAHTGSEFPNYVASKGGVLSYTRAIANELAPRAICNSISFGGVSTHLNDQVLNDEQKWNQIMNVTPMKKWVTPDEAARWIWFLLFENKSMTGQDVIVDNGEMIHSTFIW